MSKDGFIRIFGLIPVEVKDSQPTVSQKDSFTSIFGIPVRVKDSQPAVHTNNCWGNIDYSPLAPTDKLNVKVSPPIIGALTNAAATTALKGPSAGGLALGINIPTAMAIDAARGEPSFSVSITGHHGETFGHFEFPH